MIVIQAGHRWLLTGVMVVDLRHVGTTAWLSEVLKISVRTSISCAAQSLSQGCSSRGGHVPRTFLTHRQYFHPRSLICYLDLSDLTFSQSQGKSSLGRVFQELQISCCSRGFIHSLLCSLAVWGKMHPREKQRTITSFFFFSNTHSKYVWCRNDTIHAIKFPCYDLTYCNQASTVRPFKGIVHPKMKILSSFTHPQVVPNLYECVCSAEHKGRYSEECGKQSSSGAPLTSIVFFFLVWKSMVPQNSLVTNFLQNIFLCVRQNKEIHTWGWVNDDRIFTFGWTIPLSHICDWKLLHASRLWKNI